MTRPSDPDLAALREEIRRAGAATRTVRWGCGLLLLAAAVMPALAAGITIAIGDFYFPGKVSIWLRLEPVAWVLVTGGTAWALASGTRAARREQLRRSLSPLPPAARSEVLVPLCHQGGWDSRRIARRLCRDLRVSTEIAPSPAPTGRGDEVMASGEGE